MIYRISVNPTYWLPGPWPLLSHVEFLISAVKEGHRFAAGESIEVRMVPDLFIQFARDLNARLLAGCPPRGDDGELRLVDVHHWSRSRGVNLIIEFDR